jgi:hypothetical protein
MGRQYEGVQPTLQFSGKSEITVANPTEICYDEDAVNYNEQKGADYHSHTKGIPRNYHVQLLLRHRAGCTR